ncbi:hypothetical protein ACFVWY_22075 [Streptomyces sp. NPDC058195]|uniref:hypothetical protein n=1 Tax=Streptomyces sp. NPDC058195 TaxID=3346375 RepID=UPI0036F050DA
MLSDGGFFDADKFYASSRRWMHEALRHASAEPSAYDLAVHHAQVATEHLLKGFLLSVHPALIADNTTLLLHVTGAINNRTRHAGDHNLETGASITAKESLDLAREFTKRLDRVSNQRWTSVLRARNGVAHLGIIDKSAAESNLVTCFDIVDALLAELEKLGADYWSTWAEVRDSLGKSHLDEVTRRMRARLARARARDAENYGGLYPNTRREPLQWSQQGIFGPGKSGYGIPCPTGGHSGMLVGHSMQPGDGVTNEIHHVFVGHSYFCQICGLTADVEEFESINLPISLDIGENGLVDPPGDRDPLEWKTRLANERRIAEDELREEISMGRWCGFPGLECPCDTGGPIPDGCLKCDSQL